MTVPVARDTDTRPYLLERVEDAAVVQLYADGFQDVPLNQKILIYHLYEAAVAGRDIYYDQRYAHNLEMREILEEILTHADGIEKSTLEAITRYTKLFWINTGSGQRRSASSTVGRVDRGLERSCRAAVLRPLRRFDRH
jgi:dipeptidyl-peptidase-3